ncbi:hypothetical protein KQH98_06240 [Lactococcus lactis]|uniref:hypothetical protein n=1 Tax=Lactococcus lactis TaxID=1358 RepID=UPI001C0F7996|nr:hypothetical protein [Lactococcus lactis]MBU5242909.1 hypothetical protein [Lactococcus lactis]
MRRKKAEITSIYGGDGTIDSYVSHYGYVNIPRFKHKKKPISMIKALEVKDRINNKINTDIDNKIEFINDELFLNGQRIKGLKSATINVVQDFTDLTSVDLHLFANNHKK